MKSGLAFGLGLVTGAGAAGLVAHFILKQKYEQKADEEIAACREAFLEESARRRKEQDTKKAEEKYEKAVEAMRTYSADPEKAVKVLDSAVKPEPQADKPTQTGWKRPYVIDPALYDAKLPDDEYKSFGLKYYPEEGVVTEDDDELVSLEELDRRTGREALTHFGEFEDDRVCVRNDNWKVDYEICVQNRKYADVLKEKPWLKK